MLAVRTILHPTDFSDGSQDAFQLAGSLARDYGARLIIVHVAEPLVPVYGNGLYVPPTQAEMEPLQATLHQLQPQDATGPVEHRLVEGEAAREILRVAQEAKADLIVMGTHGRTGLGRLLMGSVAEEVVRKAVCPVLTVKVPQRHRQARKEAVAAGKRAAVTS